MRAKKRRQDFGNRVPAGERWAAAIIILVALAFAYEALLTDDIFFPGKSARWYRDGTPGVHVQGWAVYWMFLALVMVALIAFTFILDHYDRRFNAGFYRGFRQLLLWVMGLFVVVGIGVHLASG